MLITNRKSQQRNRNCYKEPNENSRLENTISKIKTFNGCRQKMAEESVYLKKDQWQLFGLNREWGEKKET